MARFPHLIGIDGGGSQTRARLLSAHADRAGQGRAGPSALGQGIAAAWAAIEAATHAAFQDLGLLPAASPTSGLAPALRRECALGLGLSGAENPAWVQAFLAADPGWGRVELVGDGHAALLGAHGGAAGVLIAVGTGSVGVALQPEGQWRTIGGWGWQLGDEAGGAWLGQHAVRLAQRGLDGRAASGPLARAVLAACGDTRPALLDWCAAAGQTGFAALAPLVFEHAAADPAAAALLEAAADEIVGHARALDPQATLPLALVGSLGERLRPRVLTRLGRALSEPQGDACDGALRLLAADAGRTAS